jgi:hypothetical protein
MRRLHLLVGALTLVVTMNSCSKDDAAVEQTAETALILPKKIIYKSAFDGIYTTTISYEGNKIKEFVGNTDKTVFTYTGDLITKEQYYNGTALEDEYDYSYENNKLKTTIYTKTRSNGINKGKKVYVYNTDGTITKQSYKIDITTGAETKEDIDDVFTFSNENLIKKVSTTTSGTTGNINVSKTTYTYEYDTKNNPIKNILGYNKLIDNDFDIGTNNVIKETRVSESSNNGTPNAPYTNVYNYELTYNSANFPTEKKHSYDNGTAVVTDITQFFY